MWAVGEMSVETGGIGLALLCRSYSQACPRIPMRAHLRSRPSFFVQQLITAMLSRLATQHRQFRRPDQSTSQSR